jgi:hypothetical protein
MDVVLGRCRSHAGRRLHIGNMTGSRMLPVRHAAFCSEACRRVLIAYALMGYGAQSNDCTSLGSEVALVCGSGWLPAAFFGSDPAVKLLQPFFEGQSVQRIGWILAVLLAMGWMASEIPVQNASSTDRPRADTDWRRTVDGWEKAGQWIYYSFTPRPALHPFYFGMMQCAVAAWIGVFCCFAKSVLASDSSRLPENKNKASPDMDDK